MMSYLPFWCSLFEEEMRCVTIRKQDVSDVRFSYEIFKERFKRMKEEKTLRLTETVQGAG